MARNAKCPARICHVGSSAAPTDWAMPSTMPPIKRAPHAAQPADDHGLEGQNQPDRAGRGIENGADAEQHAGDRGEDHRDAERQRVELAIVDAHQLGGVGVVGDCAEGAADAGAVKQKLQAGDGEDRDRKNQERINADVDAAGQVQARGLDRAFLEPMVVGAETLQQPVLDDDRNAEGDEKRRQQPAAERLIQQAALQRVAQRKHHGDHDRQARERIEAGALRNDQRDVAGEHDEVAMSDVDQPHDAERHRQADREQRVDTAEQATLDEDVEPLHGGRPSYIPK